MPRGKKGFLALFTGAPALYRNTNLQEKNGMDLSKDDVLKIIKIVEDSGYDEVRLEIGEFKLHVQKQASGAPIVAASGQREMPVAPDQGGIR